MQKLIIDKWYKHSYSQTFIHWITLFLLMSFDNGVTAAHSLPALVDLPRITTLVWHPRQVKKHDDFLRNEELLVAKDLMKWTDCGLLQ